MQPIQNKIYFPIFNNPLLPKRIEFILEKDGDEITKHKLLPLKDTPYYRLPVSDIDVVSTFSDPDNMVVDKKNLLKVFPTAKGYDYDFSKWIWLKDSEKKFTPSYYEYSHLNEYSNYFKTITPPKLHDYNDNHNTVLKFAGLIDGKLNDSVKNLNPYTKTGRLKDIGANSISMKKVDREKIPCKGVRVDIDVDGFHLRIISNLMDYIIPKDKKAIDFFRKDSDITGSHGEFKTEIYKSFYSERFDLIDNEFFRILKKSYRSFPSLLNDTNIFNYKIQQHEVVEMANMVLSIPKSLYHQILFYTYDGITFDVRKDRIKSFLTHLKTMDYPFSVNLLGKSYFIH